jgi:hypothetical protein
MKPPKHVTIPLPLLGLTAATRVLLGAGIALLIADKLTDDGRKAAGLSLAAVGALTTAPLLWLILGSGDKQDEDQ